MKTRNKNIIIIGSNSKFTKSFLNIKDIEKKYSKFFLISHRKYNGKISNFNIIQNVNPLYIIEIVENILNSTDNHEKFDVLVTNTPPKDANYSSDLVFEWALTSFKIMNLLSYSSKINLAIFLGSCLSFIPLFRNGIYKSIKKNEFVFYNELGFDMSKNISFCILPPLDPGTKGIGKLFSEPMSFWSKKILEEFNSCNKLILPTGILGLIIKIIIFLKFI